MVNAATCKPQNITLPPKGLWGWQGWFVIVDIAVLFVVLFNHWVPIEFAMVAATFMFVVTFIIAVSDWTVGFSNTSVLAIATLLAIGDALASTGALDYYVTKFIGRPKTLGGALLRMMVPGTFIAAWISSTAVVAIFIPIVTRWSSRIKQPVSQLLMPLSYAVHLGGTCTVIGTTTNLVIVGYASLYWCENYSIFLITPVGLPVALCGMGLLILLPSKVLPDQKEYDRRTKYAFNRQTKLPAWYRRAWSTCVRVVTRQPAPKRLPPTESEVANSEFVWHAVVPAHSRVAGLTIEEAALRHLNKLFVISVQRGDQEFKAVAGDFVLARGDVISFAGAGGDFVRFARDKGLEAVTIEASPGEQAPDVAVDALSAHVEQVVVRAGSSLVGKTPKEADFRKRYNASIIAIHRAGTRLDKVRLGQVRLATGDVLVLVTGDEFNWQVAGADLKSRAPDFKITRQGSSAANGAHGAKAADMYQAETEEISKDFLFSMKVSKKAPLPLMPSLAGQTLERAQLRNIPGVTLVAIEQDGRMHRAVGPDFVVQAGDRLWFVGDRDGLSSLRMVAGLEDDEARQVERLKVPAQHRRLIEVVLSLKSDMLFKTVREARFRTRFEAAIVAVQRQGARLFSRIGDVVLEPGDVLILDAGPNFVARFRDDENFLIVSEIQRSEPPRFDLFALALFTVTCMVVFAATLVQPYNLDLIVFTVAALGIMLAAGVTTRARMYRAIDWSIIITIAASFGLATALVNSTVAGVIGLHLTNGLISIGAGQIGVLAVLMIFTEILAAFITSKAAALVVFPIAAAASSAVGIPHKQVLIAIMLGASDYTTPQGHQINLMIMSPGAYKFTDYQKLGIPLEIGLNIAQVVCLAYIDYPYVTIPCALLFLMGCVVVDHVVVERRPVSSLSVFHPLLIAQSCGAFVRSVLPVPAPAAAMHDATDVPEVPSSTSSAAAPAKAELRSVIEPANGHDVNETSETLNIA